jgi:hypothetical protein
MPFALNDANAAHESHENTRFWPLGYRWFRRRFWTLSEPTGQLAWLELQPLLRTSFWKSKAHCANPASIGFGEWMPGLPCARGTKRGDLRSTILRSIGLGFENKKRPRPKRSHAVVDRCRPGRTRQPLLRRPQLFDWLIAETGSPIASRTTALNVAVGCSRTGHGSLLETSALTRWCL